MIVSTNTRQMVSEQGRGVGSEDALVPKGRNAEESERKAVASDEADRPQSAGRATGEGGKECRRTTLPSDTGREWRSHDNDRRHQGADEC